MIKQALGRFPHLRSGSLPQVTTLFGTTTHRSFSTTNTTNTKTKTNVATPSPIHTKFHSMEEYFHLGHVLCDQHVKTDQTQTALCYLTDEGKFQFTFDQLSDWSTKFASFLKHGLKLQKHDRIAVLLPKCPELMVAGLGMWRNGLTYVPLFTAFGHDAIQHRVLDSDAKVIVTDEANRHKLDAIMDMIQKRGIKIVVVEKGLSQQFSIGNEKGVKSNKIQTQSTSSVLEFKFWSDGILSSRGLSHESEEYFRVKSGEGLAADDPIVLLYTSGTTGKSKGVPVTTKSLSAFETYMRYGLHVEEDDVFLNIADPGWAYGLYYNVLGTLLLGKTTYFVSRQFNPSTIYQVLQDEKITNFAASPTAYRAMKAEGMELAKQYQFHVRKASSAGEPLNPEVVRFFEEIWGTRVQSHYGQTEHGMIVNYHHHPELSPKSISEVTTIGQAMPGFSVTLVDVNTYEEITEPYQTGHLVIDINNSPSRFFKGYWNQPEKTEEKMIQSPSYPDGRYFEMTGDCAYKDKNGHFFFSGRSDDVITSSGYRIGPKEVEDCLIEHPAVKESGVVGKKDELRGEMVVAFVVLRSGYTASAALEEELCNFVKKKLSAHQYPRQIFFERELPMTEAGKIKRNLLREKANA